MKKVFIFLLCVVAVFLAGAIGGLFSSGAVSSDWYALNKPGITPPSFVFPIVWNVLYFLIAVSLFISWTKTKKDKKKVAAVFGINLILNALWSVLFFGLRKPGYAFIDLIFLWVTIVLMIYTAEKIDRKAGWLLVPYLLWVSFAGVLNWLFAWG
jgi:translocator protein